MNIMKIARPTSHRSQAGFSLIELSIVCVILAIVMVSVIRGIDTTIQRSTAEQTKVDLTQEAREFVDEFERDVHQIGYPNCRMVRGPLVISAATNNCPADPSNLNEAQSSSVAVGIVYLSNTKLVFEGDVNGDGIVESVQYELVDAAGNTPPASCPCTLQRSEVVKVNGTAPWSQTPSWSQQLQNVVNSGVPGGTATYGGGVPITGNTAWGATNSAFYASLTTFKDYPV